MIATRLYFVLILLLYERHIHLYFKLLKNQDRKSGNKSAFFDYIKACFEKSNVQQNIRELCSVTLVSYLLILF